MYVVFCFRMNFGGVRMYSVAEAENILNDVNMEINFRKGVSSLKVFDKMRSDDILNTEGRNDWIGTVGVDSKIWLNLTALAKDSRFFDLYFSVCLNFNVYQLLVYRHKRGDINGYYYYECLDMTEVYGLVLDLLRELGDPNVVEECVKFC